MRMVAPVSACTWTTKSRIDARVCESSAPNGSSNSSTDGSVARARAMATRCCMPPDSCRGSDAGEVGQPHHPTGTGHPLARCRPWRSPFSSSPKATFSATVRHGYSE